MRAKAVEKEKAVAAKKAAGAAAAVSAAAGVGALVTAGNVGATAVESAVQSVLPESTTIENTATEMTAKKDETTEDGGNSCSETIFVGDRSKIRVQ